MSAGERPLGRLWTLLLVGSAGPAAFATEAALRALLLPPELEALRQELSPGLTEVAWWLLGATVPAAALGLWTKRALVRRALARLPGAPPELRRRAEERAELEAFLLASSIPQVPALLATLASLAGAETAPVLCALAVSTTGVLMLGWKTRA